MSNRFHNKWHRRNHHTYGNESNPDAGHDPIASQQQPFLGEFVLSGSLSATAPLSAYAAFLYSNNTALCAYAGTRGALIFSEGYLGAEIWSTKSTAISAYAPKVAIELGSPMRALSAYAGYLGLDIMSDVRAISARGQFVGIDVFSPRRALSAYGGQIAGEFYSHTRAISALGHYVGVESYSTSGRAISAYGSLIGGEFFSPIWGVSAWGGYVGGEFYSNNRALSAYGQIVGIEAYSPRRALSAWGGTVGLDVGSPYWGVSSYGGFIAIGAYSDNVALSGYAALTGLKIEGSRVGAAIHSPFVSLSTGGGGINVFNSRTGIYKQPGDYYGNPQNGQVVLDVGGDVWIDGSTTIMGDLSALGSISYLDTNVIVTSAFKVVNKGSAAAATIIQEGAQPILACYDQDISTAVPSLIVDGNTNGWVALGASTPDAPFNIVKSSATGQLGSANQPHVRIYDGSTNKIIIGTYGTNNGGSNAGAATNPYIGTENSAPFDIYTNNDQRISVLANGNVGVNDAGARAKLSVYADDATSNYRAISAYGRWVGGEFASPMRALSAYGAYNAGEFYSDSRALSGWGANVGLDIGSVNVALSAWGKTYGAIIAGGDSRINYDGGGSTYINSNQTVANTVTIGNSNTTLGLNGTTTIAGNTTIADTAGNTLTMGNQTGAVDLEASTLTIATGSTLGINTGTARATNINTGSGTVTTTIGNTGTVAIVGTANVNTGTNAAVSVNTGTGNAVTNIATSANTSALGLGNTSGATNINGSTIALNSGGSNNVSIGTATAGTMLTVAGPISTKANSVVTITGDAYTVGATDSAIIISNGTTTVTVTLPSASTFIGRWLYIKNITACTVNSNASNVKPLATDVAGNAILTNTAGKFAALQSDGTNWVIMMAN